MTPYHPPVNIRCWIIGWAVTAGCAGPTSAIDPFRPNICLDTDVRFCNDFDLPTADQTPFGFKEFLGGDMTSVIVIAESGNRGLSVTSQGAAFGQTGATAVGSATSATVGAIIQPSQTAPGKALVVGLLLLDGSTPDGRQVWLVAQADGTLTVDSLGISLPTTGRLEAGAFSSVRIDATWVPGGNEILLDVAAGPPGEPLELILEGHHIDLAPVPQVSAAIAIISFEPGVRRFVFDDVTLDLQ